MPIDPYAGAIWQELEFAAPMESFSVDARRASRFGPPLHGNDARR
ncbi:MAG: hypothetical protein GAK33_06638 [Burkholderia lata]|uniref:Uncharacterized protein n=1 Tax=Burkholderia lata (strain ATCC 17760 / DSM 23089 / LMG 22485 / NCIMB 9086 / R18194 / 383) TaxID=482957 RepID=A0A833UWT8_BURL3|nr:hypothetical protein [Burkholderia lata]KAF1032896.1 MAG: hypothetical protein GAK33_06638 [Burkholderia lata]